MSNKPDKDWEWELGDFAATLSPTFVLHSVCKPTAPWMFVFRYHMSIIQGVISYYHTHQFFFQYKGITQGSDLTICTQEEFLLTREVKVCYADTCGSVIPATYFSPQFSHVFLLQGIVYFRQSCLLIKTNFAPVAQRQFHRIRKTSIKNIAKDLNCNC